MFDILRKYTFLLSCPISYVLLGFLWREKVRVRVRGWGVLMLFFKIATVER